MSYTHCSLEKDTDQDIQHRNSPISTGFNSHNTQISDPWRHFDCKLLKTKSSFHLKLYSFGEKREIKFLPSLSVSIQIIWSEGEIINCMWDTSQTASYLHIKLLKQSSQGKKNLFSSAKTQEKTNQHTDEVKHSLLLTKKIPSALIFLFISTL